MLALWAPLLGAAPVGAKPATFALKAQVLHDQLGPMKRFTLTVDGQPVITDDGGVFEVPLASGAGHVIVAVSGSSYAVQYPFGGFVIVPRDPKEMPQVIVGSPRANDYLRQYLRLYQMSRQRSAREAGEVTALAKKLSDLQELLLQLHFSDTDLRAAREIQDHKDDYFPEITADVVDFKTRAADLKTAFKYTADFAFESSNALQRLQEAVVSYNYAFNKLERQRPIFEKRVADYWQSDTMTADFRQLTALALDQVHRGKIYPMQSIIGEINQYFLGGAHDKDRKKRIQDEIAARVRDLDASLPALEALSAKVLGELAE